MAYWWEIDALAAILEDEANADKSVEDLAIELISTLDHLRQQRGRVAAVVRYTIDQGMTHHQAVIGPFPADALPLAVASAEGIAGRPHRPGQGKFMIVPAYDNTRQAWEAIDPPRTTRPVAPLPPDFDPREQRLPVCRCGLPRSGPNDTGVCPRHPERTLP